MTREELQAQAREYITGQLAQGNTEIEQPPELWAEIRTVYGPRHTIFSAAGFGWFNKAMTAHQERVEEELRASLLRGLADSAAGRVHDLGDFTQYAQDKA